MTVQVHGANGARRAPAVMPALSIADRNAAFGVQGLLEIAALSAKGTDVRSFTRAVLDGVARSLAVEAAVIVTRGASGRLLRHHVGSPSVARRLLSHVRGLAWTCADEAVTWTGEARGLRMLGALVPEGGQAQVIVCAARDARAGGFLRRERELLLGHVQTAALVLQRLRLEETLERQKSDVATAFITALSSRNAYLRHHSTRVARYAEEVARILGLAASDVGLTRRTGLLHDLGKLSIPDSILLKPGPLTEEERGHIKHHPAVAAELLGPYSFLDREAAAVKRHHERYDGAGYPDGLHGRDIPLAARVVAVADAFDAMTSDRPYRAALSLEVAREEIRQGAGGQFDPEVAAAWLTIPDDRLSAMSRDSDTRHDALFRLLTPDAKAGGSAAFL